MTYDQIPRQTIRELPADHHNAVDWQRVKRSPLLRRPVRTAVTVAIGAVLGPWWTAHAVTPLLERNGPQAAFGITFLTGVVACGVMASDRIRPVLRRLAAVALVAAVTGTLYAAPVRALVAHWIMES